MSIDIAAVDFDIVDAPFGEGVSVGLKMAQDSRITSTSVVAIILVDSKLQTKTVDLFGMTKDKKFSEFTISDTRRD